MPYANKTSNYYLYKKDHKKTCNPHFVNIISKPKYTAWSANSPIELSFEDRYKIEVMKIDYEQKTKLKIKAYEEKLSEYFNQCIINEF